MTEIKIKKSQEFSCITCLVMEPATGLSHYGVATVAGAEALPKPPGAWRIIFRRFYEKIRAKIALFPNFFIFSGAGGEFFSLLFLEKNRWSRVPEIKNLPVVRLEFSSPLFPMKPEKDALLSGCYGIAG